MNTFILVVAIATNLSKPAVKKDYPVAEYESGSYCELIAKDLRDKGTPARCEIKVVLGEKK